MNTCDSWMQKGSFHEVGGRGIFAIDTAVSETNLNNKPTLCILHGFPTSSFDYWKVIDALAKEYRVIVHDHVGFGFSDKPVEYSYSLIDQTDTALQLWTQLNVKSTIVLAHDYGTSIATELMARELVEGDNANARIKIEQLVLCNGSMHIELAKLRLMQKLLRNNYVGHLVAKISNKSILGKNLKNIYFDPSKISENEIDSIWSMITHNRGKEVMHKVSRYTFERQNLWHRWIGALQDTSIPIKIIWPKNDPIAVAEMANVIKKETKNSELYWLHDAGHFPMLEIPERWSEQVLSAINNPF